MQDRCKKLRGEEHETLVVDKRIEKFDVTILKIRKAIV